MRIRFSGNQFEIQTPAKINLFLEILGRREDGFHQLETIISSVALFDTLRLQLRRDHRIEVRFRWPPSWQSHHDALPSPTDNLVSRGVELLRRDYLARHPDRGERLFGIDVCIDKRIPVQAGLGGASSDAAAALIGVNRLWNCGYQRDQLANLGAALGSDVPFFFNGGTAVCRGRGDQVGGLKCPANLWTVIATPPVGIATAEVYRRCEVPDLPRESTSMQEEMSTGKIQRIAKQLFNRLESVASGITDWIADLRSAFSSLNCLGHQMTGSGSSYFGLFLNRITALQAAGCLSNRYPDASIFACQTLGRLKFCQPCPATVQE